MRLAQIARRLNVTQNELIKLLKDHSIEIAGHGNTKLNDEAIELINKYFPLDTQPAEDKAAAEESQGPEIEQPTVDQQNNISTENEPPIIDTAVEEPDNEETNVEDDEKSLSETKEEAEVIRAKKIKLEGIKVVGKIELPEPAPKEETKVVEEKSEDSEAKRKKRPGRNPRNPKHKSKQRKSLSYEEKLQREQQRIEQEKERRLREIKEKKKRHYFENIQPNTGTSKVKKKKKKSTDSATTFRKKERPQYKNPIRKFWAWLNGEYD